MKQLYSSKRILAFILTFFMIVSNIKLIPVLAEGEVAKIEKVLYSQDFSGNVTVKGTDDADVIAKGGNAIVAVEEGGYLYFYATANSDDPSKRAAINIGSLTNKTEFVIELSVKTTNEGHQAEVGLSTSISWGDTDTLWTGTTSDNWKQIKIVCTVNDDKSIVSQASVKNGDAYEESGDPVTLTKVTGDTETVYLMLRPNKFINGAYTCFDNIKVTYTKTYETLQEAINDAVDGETIEVVGNITLDADVKSTNANITINSGVTLDLNGNTLDMVNNCLYSLGYVVDNSSEKAGLLKVDSANCVFSTANSQVPVYNGEGYVFATITPQELNKSVAGTDTFELVFKPLFGETINNSLANSSVDTKISFRIRLDWKVNGTSVDPVYLEYTDEMVQQVYGNGMAFSIKASGVSNYEGLTITPLIVSDQGAEWTNGSFGNFVND